MASLHVSANPRDRKYNMSPHCSFAGLVRGWKIYPEGAALADVGFEAYVPAHVFYNLLADVQAEAGAASGPRSGRIGL